MSDPDRTCTDCGVAISRQSRTGRCHRHAMRALHADPAYQANRRSGLARHFADPAARSAAGARLRMHNANMSVAEIERRREHGRWLAREILTPERRAKAQTPEARERSAAKCVERRLGWCPPDRRDQYRDLVRCKRYSAAEARAMIEADIALELARATPFERQLAAVRAGATLVRKAPMPSRCYDVTLGGIASGSL